MSESARGRHGAKLSLGPRAETTIVDAVVDFDSDPPARTARFVQFLRDSASSGMDVRWVGRSARAGLAHKLAHLPPPVEPLNPSEAAAWRDWLAVYRLGLLYRRV